MSYVMAEKGVAGVAARSIFGKIAAIRWTAFGLCLLTGIGILYGSPQAPASEARRLTDEMIRREARLQWTESRHRRREGVELENLARQRRIEMEALLARDPAEFLRVALPDAFRRRLPASVRPLIERETLEEGTLEVLYEDGDSDARLVHLLETESGRLTLHYAGAAPEGAVTGDRLTVRGVRLGSSLALESNSQPRPPSLATSVAPYSFGRQRTLVIAVNFPDKQQQPYTLGAVYDMVFGSADDYFMENSYGQTWLEGSVYGWYTLAIGSTVCDPYLLAAQAKDAAVADGADLSAYNRYLYVFPKNSCSWAGAGTVGGNPSQGWINGSLRLKTVAHELGHNFGDRHSHNMDCGAAPVGDSCTISEYGDSVCVMGSASTAHLNPFQKERLGWLDYGSSPPITSVSTSGTYWLEPYSTAGGGPKALKILESQDPVSGRRTYYYVEARRPYGFDGWVSGNANISNGVVIRKGTESNSDSSYLLDMTPATASWTDPALTVGQVFQDPVSGVAITPVSVGNSGAEVRVDFQEAGCALASPSVSVSPSATQWVSPGTRVSYGVSVTNQDGAGCPASTFDLGSILPDSQWQESWSARSLTLGPGANGTVNLSVTSPASAAEGFHDIGVVASKRDAAGSTTAWVTQALVSALDVQVGADRSSYRPNQSVSISVAVLVGASAVAGAGVQLRIVKPDGSSSSLSGVTGGDGMAAFKLRIKAKDPLGEYLVSASVSFNGYSGEASTVFSVNR